jgi:hypothetical protein
VEVKKQMRIGVANESRAGHGEGIPRGPGQRLFTIGHSNHEFSRFLALLREAQVTAVADVRSSPFSQRYPQFSRGELEQELRAADLVYVYLGNFLGGRPQHPSLYTADGRVDYERVRATRSFQLGLDRLRTGLDDYAVALLCAEEDPLDCHRGLMITPAIKEHGLAPVHLRGDGSVETTAAMEDRLLAVTKVGVGIVDGLFADMVSADERALLLADAYRVMARRRAFRHRADETEIVEE